MIAATAIVTTERPERYAKQLASHLGRRTPARDTDAGTVLVIAGGECLLKPAAAALELHASAPDAESLERVQDVVGRHLERFGEKDGLSVVWEREV